MKKIEEKEIKYVDEVWQTTLSVSGLPDMDCFCEVSFYSEKYQFRANYMMPYNNYCGEFERCLGRVERFCKNWIVKEFEEYKLNVKGHHGS